MSTKREKILAKEGLLDEELVFGIDKNLLDDEWLGQPKLYFNWAIQLEDARADFEEVKAAFDVVKAEVDLEIRTTPDAYDLVKATEKSIAAALIVQPEYEEAQQKVFTAKHRVGILQAAVTALDHRKKALEKLVDLHGQKYFATPRASEQSREAVERIEKLAARGKKRTKKAKRSSR